MNTPMHPAPLYDAAALVDFADALLTRAGMAAPLARSVAQTLVDGDLLGHDTHGLALLVESLTGGLAGHGRADPREGWGATVYLTLHDLEAFGGKREFLRQMDHVADACRSNRPIDAARPVRLPGEQGLARRVRQLNEGVRLHSGIAPALEPLAQKYGLDFSKTRR